MEQAGNNPKTLSIIIALFKQEGNFLAPHSIQNTEVRVGKVHLSIGPLHVVTLQGGALRRGFRPKYWEVDGGSNPLLFLAYPI